MNKIIVSGNLTNNVEIRQSENGKAFAKGSVAVKREFKNSQGEYDVDFIDFVVFGKDAEYLSKYSTKGCRVEIVGRLQVRTIENNTEKRKVSEIVVESVNAYKRESETFTYNDAIESQADKNDFDFGDADLPF